ncbi:DUF4367 domain-containing protein [Gracilibacillus sp. HCP3S3_G5_1]|uniref:DUF4367 domain-containing protein n=1 Tax=unclassified Gracilibacillus TaxID=2625209 RepID=UPI003F8C9CBA
MMDEEYKWKKLLREDYEKVEESPSSKEENWRDIVSEISKTTQSQKKMPKKSILVAAMIAVIVIGSAFASSDQLQAFDWIVKMFVTSDGSTTQISQSTTEDEAPSTDSLPDFNKITTEEVQAYSEEMDFEEAQAVTEFPISKPAYLPGSYQLDTVTVFYEDNSAFRVQLSYIDDRDNLLTLLLTNQPNDFANAKVIDNGDTEVKTIALSDGEARLLKFKDDLLQLVWSTPTVNWKLEGAENEETLVKIAESIE